MKLKIISSACAALHTHRELAIHSFMLRNIIKVSHDVNTKRPFSWSCWNEHKKTEGHRKCFTMMHQLDLEMKNKCVSADIAVHSIKTYFKFATKKRPGQTEVEPALITMPSLYLSRDKSHDTICYSPWISHDCSQMMVKNENPQRLIWTLLQHLESYDSCWE